MTACRVMLRVAIRLLLAGSLAPATLAAQDLALEASTVPPAPWTPFEPVQLVLTVQNLGTSDAQTFIQLDGLHRSNGLVRGIVPRPESTGACMFACPDFSPNPDDLFFCVRTAVIAPSSSRTCTFDLLAFADASGGVQARFSIFPTRPPGFLPAIGDDPGNNTIVLPIAYGALGTSYVPTLHAWGLLILAACLLAAAGASRFRSGAMPWP